MYKPPICTILYKVFFSPSPGKARRFDASCPGTKQPSSRHHVYWCTYPASCIKFDSDELIKRARPGNFFLEALYLQICLPCGLDTSDVRTPCRASSLFCSPNRTIGPLNSRHLGRFGQSDTWTLSDGRRTVSIFLTVANESHAPGLLLNRAFLGCAWR
jgi:hypothetical protein